MAQKFYTLNDVLSGKKPKKETQFTALVLSDAKPQVHIVENRHRQFDNVVLIGRGNVYGDVFKAWNDGDENNFLIYIGVAGDEFLT